VILTKLCQNDDEMLTLNKSNRLLSGRWLFILMLGLLHGTFLLGLDSIWARPLLLGHLGLFLLWQPVWRGEHEVGGSGLAFIILAAAVAMFWLNWWTVAFWLTGIFGLVGARVFSLRDRWARLLYLVVMAYLLAILLLWVVPHLFSAKTTIEVGRVLIWYVLPVMLIGILFIPSSKDPPENIQTLDFIYSLLLFMLLTLVVLGTLALMTLAQLDYLGALLRSLFLIALVLLALGGLWSPRFGFSGLQVMFSRYLLNVGTPFEDWLTQLAEAAQLEPDPSAYLKRAISLLSDFPWLSGLSWQSPDGNGQIGSQSNNDVRVQEGELLLTLYAKQSLNPSVLLHIHLLAQLIGYFYQAKQREQSLRDITRLQAVYQTGSRLTHDLKNMLQSLLALTSLAQSQEPRAQQLLKQQLPQLTQRIESIMNKLQQPQADNEPPQMPVDKWWEALQQRKQYQQVNWSAAEELPDRNIPSALFDCVLDNLLENAYRKKQLQPGIKISVEIKNEPFRVAVSDTGDVVPEKVATNLLRGVVASENGLGIGLYQAARWAEQLGYKLSLINNQTGNVCFEIRE